MRGTAPTGRLTKIKRINAVRLFRPERRPLGAPASEAGCVDPRRSLPSAFVCSPYHAASPAGVAPLSAFAFPTGSAVRRALRGMHRHRMGDR